MKLIKSLFGEPVTIPEQVSFSEPDLPDTPLGVAFFDAWRSHFGATPNGIAAVYRSTQFLSDVVAQFPLRELDESTGKTSTPMLLETPDPSITLQEFLHEVVQELLWTGNAFIWIPEPRQPGRYAESVFLIPTDQIVVTWSLPDQLYRVYSWIRPDGTVKELKPNRDVLHISLNRRKQDLLGKGPIQSAENLLSAMSALDELYRRFFENDATPSGILKVKHELTDEQARKYQQQWESRHKGARRVAVLDLDIDWIPSESSMQTGQVAEAALNGTRQVATLFGLDGFFLNVESGGSGLYQNVNDAYFRLYRETVGPTYVTRLQNHLSLLLPPGKRVVFDPSSILELDETRRSQALSLATWMTDNEKREREGLPPTELQALPASSSTI